MRYTWFLALVSGSAATSDPCTFIGFRVAKWFSKCVDGFCTGLSIDRSTGKLDRPTSSDPSLVNVSCAEASAIRMSIYGNMRTSDEPQRKHLRIDLKAKILNEIGTAIIPAIRDQLYMDKPCSVREVMAEVDEYILKLSSDEDSWASVSQELIGSPEMAELRNVLKLLVHKSLTSPAHYDFETGIAAPFYHFMYDLMSVLDLDVLSFDEAYAIRRSVNFYKPIHREQYTGEAVSTTELPPPLVFAKMIDALLKEEERKDIFFWLGMILKFDRRSFEGSDAATQILNRKIRTVVCQKLVFISRLRFPGGMALFLKKAVVSAIQMCPNTQLKDRLIASKRIVYEGGLGYLPSSIEFYDDSLPWIRGLDTRIPNHTAMIERAMRDFLSAHAVVKQVNFCNEFATISDFDSREDFEHAMRSLGRAIALSVVVGFNYKRIVSLPASLTSALVSKGDRERLVNDLQLTASEKENDSLVDAILATRVYEPIFFIRQGMENIFGPAGFRIFRSDEWSISPSRSY